MFRRWSRPQKFILAFEEPVGDTAPRRVQRIAGLIQSDRPLPNFRVLLDGVEQAVCRHDLGDPQALADRRHTAYFTFHRELAFGDKPVALDVRAGDRAIAHRTFLRDKPDDRGDARPLLLLMHIPKTAGTSLRLALELQREVRMLRLYSDRAFLPLAACESLSAAAFDDLDVVFGHFHYGLHARIRRPCRYMTVVRHPADLLRSIYFFNKYVVGTDHFARSGRIDDAFAAAGQDNSLTRMICGKMDPAPVDAADLAKAVAIVEAHFDYVGTVDDMGAVLRIVGERLGVTLSSQEVNVTPPTPESRLLSREEVVARCDRLIAHDMRLYDHVRTVFASGARG